MSQRTGERRTTSVRRMTSTCWIGERSSAMARPPGADPEAGAISFLRGPHDGPHPPHPGKLVLDQPMTSVDAVVGLRVGVVEGPGPAFEGSAGQAEPQAGADAVAQFRVERRELHSDRRGLLLIHSSVLSDGARPNPPAAFWQQRAVLTCAMV